ncbi:extensin family protein [Tsuneonella mangrovi]|uniref:extensin-like domain-containing protein n=1 Tax=Tsuneonella mangrovi TaxID=1982042 RepID=UPI001F0A07A0|nr:extensin family protein [Tsuneonella mangrovi]
MTATLAGCGNLIPDSRAPARPAPSVTGNWAPSSNERMCLASLGRDGTDFNPVPDKYYGAGCSTLDSVTLASLQGDDRRFTLANLGPVACPLADTLAGWARYGIDRAARIEFGSPLARIETFGSYSCRNVAGSSRRSAHARAEAIDVSAFVLADGRRITVAGGWNGTEKEREFLRVVHASACKRFGTVLGPGYNAAHHDHFHVELGGGGYCR